MASHRLLFVLLFLSTLLSSCILSEEVDLVVHNATIYSVDEGFSKHQAMAIKDGRIVELGPEHQIRNKYKGKESYDAGTNFIYPGFIDAHCHFLGYGLSLQRVDLRGTKSYQEVLDQVVAFAPNARGKWITGRGWDQNDWDNKSFPNKQALDSLFPDRPVALRRIDGHAALVNQLALELAGITTDTEVEGGAVIVEDGQLTGILLDNAYDLVEAAMPEPSAIEKTKALLDAQKDCFAVGLTTVSDAGLHKDEIELIQEMHEIGELKMKIYAMISDNPENLEHFLGTGPIQTDRLTVRSFKFYADGALGSRGACLLEPYSDAPTTGFLLSEPAYYEKQARIMHEAGFQMNTHCIGDSAVRLILDTYGAVLGGSNDKRWRIEHAQVVHPDDLAKFGNFTVIPSVQPTHATSDMYWAQDRLGEERINGAYAYADLLAQTGILPLGTDFPVEQIDPLLTFYAAASRKDTKGYPADGFNPKHALSREQTLRGMTIWAALANFEEEDKGSLEVGKKADFTVLNADLMSIPVELIPQSEVVGTFIDGEQVYKR